MIIGIDASRALAVRRTGTERYSLEIIRHLLALPEAADHAFRLYVPTDPPATDESPMWADPRVDVRVLPAPRLGIKFPMWTHSALAWEIVRRHPDVLFVPSHVIPFVPPRLFPPTVVTLHDVGYRHFPTAHTAFQRFYLELSTRWSSFSAAHVIAPSKATAEDLAGFYGTQREKIHVIGEGVNRLQQAESPGINQSQTVRPYALYVGTIQPRKNLARLIDAYAQLVKSAAIGWDLVIAGGLGWLSSSFQAQVAQAGLVDRVHFPGYVPDGSLPALLQDALFFAFPSLCEGFGLPVLEAQQMGLAVMTSNNSSLPEVAGDAALLVDPTDVDAIADAMLRLSQDEALRQELIAKGYENVKRFSWEKAARETLVVLVKAAGKG